MHFEERVCFSGVHLTRGGQTAEEARGRQRLFCRAGPKNLGSAARNEKQKIGDVFCPSVCAGARCDFTIERAVC